MRRKYNFLNPLLMAVLAMCCLWVVTDVAYGVRIWERSVNEWGKERIAAFLVILVMVFTYYLFFIYLVNTFLNKSKDQKPRPGITEYLTVGLFILITFNISLYIVITYINHASYRWGEAQMINAAGIPIFLLYYISIRNNLLAERYTDKIIQLERLKVDQLETQLKLLRSQYHPHFLFNALNTVYFQIDEENEEAIEAVELLSNLLRYQLYDINTQVTVQQEIDYLKTYIRFQRLRMTERLQLEQSFDPTLAEQKIHPLLFQPLLENAFKHVGGDYRIEIQMKLEDSTVHFMVKNTVTPDTSENEKKTGIGIDNLKKRLELLYPLKHELSIMNEEGYFTVHLFIELSE